MDLSDIFNDFEEHGTTERQPKKKRLINGVRSFISGLFLSVMAHVLYSVFMERASYRNKVKRRLKCFNPVIKKDFWGNERIEWVGRDKPLTDEELEIILK